MFDNEALNNFLITLLIGVGGVGGILPMINAWLSRESVAKRIKVEKERLSEIEVGKVIRDELRLDLEEAQLKTQNIEIALDLWRSHAYDLREKIVEGKQGVINVLEKIEGIIGGVKAEKPEGDAKLERARKLAEDTRKETAAFQLPPTPRAPKQPPRSAKVERGVEP